MKALAAVLIIATLGCGPARADWAYTNWGMTPEQVAARSSGDVKVLPKAGRTRSDDDEWEISAAGTFKDGPRVLNVGFMFGDKDGLRCVLYNAYGADAEAVKAALIKKLGPGEASEYGPIHTITWATPDKIDITIGNAPVAAVVEHCRPGE